MTTMTIRRRDYAVTKKTRVITAGPRQGQTEAYYTFEGKRGALFGTMRNAKRPELMFLFNDRGNTRTMDGVWLTDADGELKVVSQ